MSSFTLVLCRENGKRINMTTLRENLDGILVKSNYNNDWRINSYEILGPKNKGDKYLYETHISFDRHVKLDDVGDLGRLQKEYQKIVRILSDAGSSGAFLKYPWVVSSTTDATFDIVNIIVQPVESSDKGNVDDDEMNSLIDFEEAIALEDLNVPDVLINGTDEEIENHPCFAGIFSRAAHIRVIFSSLQTMKSTNGQRRNHCLLHGLPACAKSKLFNGTQQVLGKGGFLLINSNSATRAGIEKIFLKGVRQTGLPPVLFIEEIEKTHEQILTTWLSILDERAEVRKVTNKEASSAPARILCFATANDKVLFDRLMGGRPNHPGALSSRFTKKLYVPRPNWDTMRRILLRDIELYGGKSSWSEKCIEIAKEVGTNDPRTILGFLDGADRLLTGEYKNDIMKIYEMEQSDKKFQMEENDDMEIAA